MVEPEKSDKNFDPLSSRFDKLNLLEERDKDKLRSWLGKILRVVITDGRCVVGRFICTDRDGNTILENTWEYTDPVNDKDSRYLGLALVPGKHIITIHVMNNL